MCLVLVHKERKPAGWVIPRIVQGKAPLPTISIGHNNDPFTIEDVSTIRKWVSLSQYASCRIKVEIPFTQFILFLIYGCLIKVRMPIYMWYNCLELHIIH